jgi:hypothetical protein
MRSANYTYAVNCSDKQTFVCTSPEAVAVTEFSETFSGRQPRQGVKVFRRFREGFIETLTYLDTIRETSWLPLNHVPLSPPKVVGCTAFRYNLRPTLK